MTGWRSASVGLLLVLGCTTAPDLAGRHTLPDLGPGDTDPALGYESPPRFRARDVLPPSFRRGPHHRVTDPVTSDGFLHVFVLTSDFGRFEVAGDALLRQRLGEITALAALEHARRDPEFARALTQAGERPFIARWKLVDEPVGDPLGMPEEAWQELLAIDAMQRADREEGEQRALESYLRFEQARSQLADRLDVDEHAQNPALQRELNRTALAIYAGGFPLEAIPAPEPLAPGSHHPFASADSRLARLLSRESAEDLRRVDRIELAVLGVPPALRQRALEHRWITPRHLTILVSALVAMEGVSNRPALIEAALDARSETDDLVYQRIAEMLRAIHEHVAPVVALTRGDRFVRATLADGRRVIPVEVDRLIWTGALERMIENAALVEDAEAFDELWLSGSASARARTELAARGFVVVERVFERLEARQAVR